MTGATAATNGDGGAAPDATADREADARIRRFIAEREAVHSAEVGFDDRRDHAALVVEFNAAMSSRYHEANRSRTLGPILRQARRRYGELRGKGFEYADRVARTEAIRSILAILRVSPRRK